MNRLIQELHSFLERTSENVPVVGNDLPVNTASVCMKLLTRCSPLLGIYSNMVGVHVAESLCLHRTMGKMLSVLLSVFTELSEKVGPVAEFYLNVF